MKFANATKLDRKFGGSGVDRPAVSTSRNARLPAF